MLPREKFKTWGVKSLSLYELIAVIISSGSKNRDVFKISKDVEKIFKRGELEYSQLVELSGLGEVKAMKLMACYEISKRLGGELSALVKIIDSNMAYETLKGIGRYKQEHFVCIFLNARYEQIAKKTLGIGSVGGVQILPRDIILTGLTYNASYVIMGHNHPSGDPTPSQQDYEVTCRVKEALDLVGMKLIDHIVVCRNGWARVDFN